MSKKIKDSDYICLSAMLRAKEAKLLTREKLERILTEPGFNEAARAAEEAGYPDMSGMDSRRVNETLAKHMAEELDDIKELLPDESLLDLKMAKYSYHNAKVVVKSRGDISGSGHLISDSGRYSADEIMDAYTTDDGETELPKDYAQAIRESKLVLARTENPQIADYILDKAYFAELIRTAERIGKKFLVDYVKALIDSANLRSALRAMHIGKRTELLQYALIEGGTVGIDEILNSMDTKEDLVRLYSSTIFAKAAQANDITSFELAADNAVNAYLAGGAYIPFGPTVVIEYITAVESEIMALRIILSGKLMGIATEKLRERLRDSYV